MFALVNTLLSAGGLDPALNYSLFAVPGALATCLLPHYIAVLAAGFNVYDNSNPRSFRDNLTRDTSVDKIHKARILRWHAASSNGLETLGFFAGSVLAANFAGVDIQTLNALSFGYVLARTAFVLAYVGIRNRRLSWARSVLWNVASWSSIALWILAASKVSKASKASI